MLRKFIIIFICLILTCTTSFAGDIPESLMSGNQKALFIGKLTDADSGIYTITPVTVMMGSIEQKEIKVNKFEKYYGTNDIAKKGDILVAILLEEGKIDNLWVFKATSDDYKTLKLKSKKTNMVERYETYINEGKYFEAQKRIDEKVKVESQKETSVQYNKTETSDSTQKNAPSKRINLIVIFLGGIACAFYILVSRKWK